MSKSTLIVELQQALGRAAATRIALEIARKAVHELEEQLITDERDVDDYRAELNGEVFACAI